MHEYRNHFQGTKWHRWPYILIRQVQVIAVLYINSFEFDLVNLNKVATVPKEPSTKVCMEPEFSIGWRRIVSFTVRQLHTGKASPVSLE